MKLQDIPARFVVTFLGFLGFFIVFALRVALSVSLVAMVRSPQPLEDGKGGEWDAVACPELLKANKNVSALQKNLTGEFDWDAKTQAAVLGAFFYGYTVMQIPGGVVAEQYGAKWPLGVSVLGSALVSVLTPILARWNVWAFIGARALAGLGEGMMFPAMNAMLGRWAPKLERSRLSSIIFTGTAVGTVASVVVSGFLCDSDIMGGWPSVFYLFGILGFAWVVMWAFLMHESPDVHPYISKEELLYIRAGQDDSQCGKKLPTPWKSILTSVPVWALVVAHFGFDCGFLTFLTEMPTFLAQVLHFDITKNGVVSAMPYVAQAVVAPLGSLVADGLRKSGRFSITTIRKAVNSISFFGMGACMLGIVFVDCSPFLNVLLLTMTMGFSGLAYSAFNITHVDMSPEFAGTLYGLTNFIANFVGFLAPAYVGYITQDGPTLHNWNIVFLTAGVIMFFCACVFNIFGTAEYQNWSNKPEQSTLPIHTIVEHVKLPSFEGILLSSRL